PQGFAEGAIWLLIVIYSPFSLNGDGTLAGPQQLSIGFVLQHASCTGTGRFAWRCNQQAQQLSSWAVHLDDEVPIKAGGGNYNVNRAGCVNTFHALLR
ncbi:MAG: hypothetical protein ACKVIS_20730, partial [Pseudomonadales bacterium]